MKSQNHKKCEGCYYFKPRDVDPETGELAWGPWCLESGQPIRCADEAANCDKGESQEDHDQERASAKMALKYATRNKRKR